MTDAIDASWGEATLKRCFKGPKPPKQSIAGSLWLDDALENESGISLKVFDGSGWQIIQTLSREWINKLRTGL